jgi:hypothetical protein
MEVSMVYLAYFAAGLLLANGIPHFVNGISGHRFQSPFSSPPGVGESPPLTNVIWGLANFIIGYLLLVGVGEFQSGLSSDALAVGLGFALMSIILSIYFGRIRSRHTDNQIN